MTCGDVGKMTEMTTSPLSGVGGGIAYIDMTGRGQNVRFLKPAAVDFHFVTGDG